MNPLASRGRTRLLVGTFALTLVLPSVASAQAPPWVCVSGPGQDYVKAGRLLDALSFGPTPDLLYELATSGVGQTPTQWTLDQLDNAYTPQINPELDALLAVIELPEGQGDPDGTIDGLAQHQIARALFSRWQLLERLVYFWEQHFTTDVFQVRNGFGGNLETAIWFEHEENRKFREGAFGEFGDLLYASATSPAMLKYLDLSSSTKEKPNENYARELLELHTLYEVEGAVGESMSAPYTADDVADVARALTGWTIAAVAPGDENNPHADPVDPMLISDFYRLGDVNTDGIINQIDIDILQEAKDAFDADPMNYVERLDIAMDDGSGNPIPGADMVNGQEDIDWAMLHTGLPRLWVHAFHFDPDKHDFTMGDSGPNTDWTIFQGIPELTVTLPAAGPVPEDGILMGLALLDHLANVQQTRRSISRKLYAYFISDEEAPTATIDGMDAAWASSNGNIRTVVRQIFGPNDLFDPSTAVSKAKTPFKYVVSVPRALGAALPATNVLRPIDDMHFYLQFRFGYRPFRYPSPEGFSDGGGDQVSTGRMLSAIQYNQQTWDTDPAYVSVRFDYDFASLLSQYVSDIRNPQLVQEYLVQLLFQCNWSQDEHDVAWDFLNTDTAGNPIVLGTLPNYEEHISKYVSFLLSNAQFGLQ